MVNTMPNTFFENRAYVLEMLSHGRPDNANGVVLRKILSHPVIFRVACENMAPEKLSQWLPLMDSLNVKVGGDREGSPYTTFPYAWHLCSLLERIIMARGALKQTRESGSSRRLTKNAINLMDRLQGCEVQQVHVRLWRIATSISPRSLVPWVTREAQWLVNQANISGSGQDLALLIRHCLSDSRTKALAVELTKVVLKAHDARPDTAEPERLEDWDFGETVRALLPLFIDRDPKLALDIFGAALERHLSRGRRHTGDDGLVSRRPAIEDHANNWDHGVVGELVSAVRDSAMAAASASSGGTVEILQFLEEKDSPIFSRIAIHLLRNASDRPFALIRSYLLDRQRFDDYRLRHEYTLLLRKEFAGLDVEDRYVILDWIAAGPSPEDLQRYRERAGTKYDESAYALHWKLTRLQRIANDAGTNLPREWRDIYAQWATLTQKDSHPDFASWSESWSGPTSPKSVDDLKDFTARELVNFLSQWEPNPGPRESSREGLARNLTETIRADPSKYLSELPRLTGLHPILLDGFLRGLGSNWASEDVFPWQNLLELAEWIVVQRNSAVRDVSFQEEDDDERRRTWRRPCMSFLSLLRGGLSTKSSFPIPFDFRFQVWGVLSPLLWDPEPTVENEIKVGLNEIDPAHEAINSVRGVAMEALVDYALWVRRVSEAGPQVMSRSNLAEIAVKIREELDAHLDTGREKTLTIHSIYGRFLPWLQLLDRQWVKSKMDQIFPITPDGSLRWWAAWRSYILFCNPYDDVFELIADEYRRAIEFLKSSSPGKGYERQLVRSRLGEHLLAFYWRDQVDLSNQSLLRFFFEAADSHDRAAALLLVTRSLGGEGGKWENDVSKQAVLRRLEDLWEWRLAEIEAHDDPVRYGGGELMELGRWFATGEFDSMEALERLARSLHLLQGEQDVKYYQHNDMFKMFAHTVPKYPELTLKVLRLLLQLLEANLWMDKEDIDYLYSILRYSGASGSTLEATLDIVNWLGERGFDKEFLALYKELVHSK